MTVRVVRGGAAAALVIALVAGEGQAQPAPGVDEPYLAPVPDACQYLTEALASGILRAEPDPSSANEHLPNLQSTCVYTGQGVSPRRQVGFTFKFMVWDLFDMSLPMMALEFNAQFTGGGNPPTDRIEDLGKLTFAFDDPRTGRTTVMMVTGIQGSPGGDGRPRELVATYFFEDRETPQPERLAELLSHARRHLAEWMAAAQPAG